ncbi:MAG TPA: hypothetical protein VMR77_04080 [Patescibacteria group bacterium]|jgi:hypothetical protein|nr:hypothetical protein [Patescibacteria group bacterium]
MNSKRDLFLLILLFAIAVGGFYYYFSHQSIPRQISVVPTITPVASSSATVLGTSSSSSKCHAIKVDTSDAQAVLPDPNCTPGEIDLTVTQDNIFTTICHAGYTQTVRPPVSYTNALKKQQIVDYGYQDVNMKDYEEDHFISLELGGSPAGPKNLWPEPHPSFNEKDTVENYLHSQVCSGNLTLTQAQQEISKNWYAIYQQIK